MDHLPVRRKPCYTYAQLDDWGMRMKRSSTKDLLLSAGLAVLMLLVIMAATIWLIQRIAGG